MTDPRSPQAAPPDAEPAPTAAPADGAAVDDAPRHNGDGDRMGELEHRAATFEDQARRALADLENSHKRYVRDLEQARAAERARVAKQFLPLVDHLELALSHADAEPTAIVQGVEHVLTEAIEVLRRLGFPRIDQPGERFDPAKHEAVSAIDVDDAEPGTVVHVIRPGYGEGSDQLRPASVVVSTGSQ